MLTTWPPLLMRVSIVMRDCDDASAGDVQGSLVADGRMRTDVVSSG